MSPVQSLLLIMRMYMGSPGSKETSGETSEWNAVVEFYASLNFFIFQLYPPPSSLSSTFGSFSLIPTVFVLGEL